MPSNIPNPEDYWMFAEKTLRIFMMLISVSCLVKMNSIFFQAVGKPTYAIIASMIRDMVCFVPLILIMPLIRPDVEMILYASPLADFLALLVTAVLCVSFIRSLNRAMQ
jgi:Na+-driven multidrug efflux pump